MFVYRRVPRKWQRIFYWICQASFCCKLWPWYPWVTCHFLPGTRGYAFETSYLLGWLPEWPLLEIHEFLSSCPTAKWTKHICLCEYVLGVPLHRKRISFHLLLMFCWCFVGHFQMQNTRHIFVWKIAEFGAAKIALRQKLVIFRFESPKRFQMSITQSTSQWRKQGIKPSTMAMWGQNCLFLRCFSLLFGKNCRRCEQWTRQWTTNGLDIGWLM